MTTALLWVSVAYALLFLAILVFELGRSRHHGPDIVSLFMVVSLLQVCVPGLIMFGTLPFVDPAEPTGNPFFDKVFQDVTLDAALLVLGLTAWFYACFYVGIALTRLGRGRAVSAAARRYTFEPRYKWLVVVLLLGLLLTVLAFWSLGDSILTRYATLILFRDQVEDVERNAFTANAFALLQTWSWLSVVTIFTVYQRRGAGRLFTLCILIAVSFAVLSVSRRALFIPLLMSYLAVVLHTRKWHFRWLLGGAAPLVLWLAFGKNILGAVAYGGSVESVVGSYASWASAMLRAASEAGITVVESLGTVLYLDIGPRFGVDHMMALIKLLPEGALGLDFNFPERIVRISTEAFSGPYALDIPPGFLGQMWLDFGLLGPLVWGLLMGLQVALLQLLYERTTPSWASAALMALLLFLIAYPVNTGSLDFSFSSDIVVMLVVLFLVVRTTRSPAAEAPDAPLGASAVTST
ncbi:MAG TPA: hypothetical protein VFY20_05405 [Gemmatimonadales bacterium]|nr:hypothetical protein [Gemmatimonadales bacterium]